MESTNTASASAAQAPHKKLLDFVRNNRLDPAAVLESRRKDIEALASVNVTLLGGLQSLVRQQAEFLCDAAADLQALSRGQAVDGTAPAKLAEALPRSLQKAVAGVRGLTDTLYKAQADSISVVGRRIAENVEEVKGILRPKQ
ncbi:MULTISPECIES: TIGR01841 family phasin [unclassified Cupriavidus]|uniref:TIGR01841 family phasin n=1 Tax=unclassified Cupriavidus TaxID=2640874 RepID=UPI0003FBE9C8|nr:MULTISPECIES: TIGR01841 family phasin [unclassified Cupriavidus]MBP0627686.1 TIGR01841 family phasin [Cupriavidus sp. AcVe19-1a]MBP0635574.1 TIGR01841 family phasin [Cupriavidus sp. AcVe19-6a]